MKYISAKSFREFKSLFSQGKKSSFVYFLSELVVFFLIASFSAFLVSFPIFYVGTSYTAIYKTLGVFLIVFCLFVLFIYRVIFAFREQNRSRELGERVSGGVSGIGAGRGGSLKENIRNAVYSFPYIFPLWLRSLSVFILFCVFLLVTAVVLLKLITYLWLLFISFPSSLVLSIDLWLAKVLGTFIVFGADYFLFLLFLFFILFLVIVLFSARSIMSRYNFSFLLWLLFGSELVIFFFIFYVFIFFMFHILF